MLVDIGAIRFSEYAAVDIAIRRTGAAFDNSDKVHGKRKEIC